MKKIALLVFCFFLLKGYGQVGDASLITEARPYNVYIGGNSCYGNLEDGVDIKQCSNIIISSNTFYNQQGSGVVIHNNPINLWVINNTIHNTSDGIVSTGADGVNILGNLVYNVHRTPGTSADNIWTNGISIKAYSSQNVSIIGNTIWDYSKGIALGATSSTTPSYTVINNLFGERKDVDSHEMIFDNGVIFTNIQLSNNIFYHTKSFSFAVTSARYTTISQLQTVGKCAGCQYDSVLSVMDPASLDFHLASDSKAIDAGISLNIYNNYPFPASIKFDKDGMTRPFGSEWDVGAYELAGETIPILNSVKIVR